MNINSSLLFDEVYRLGHSLYDGVSKDRLSDESRSLSAFNTILYDLTGTAFNCNVILEKYPYLKNRIIRDNNKGLLEFFERVKKDERLFKILLANYYNSCIDTDMFNFTKFYSEKKYTEKEVKELVYGFYSMFGNTIYNIVKKYFDENRIQTGSGICESRTDATFYNSLLLKSGYIVVKEEENNIKLLTSLVHELGHAVDYGMFYHPQQKKGKFYSDIYQEVPSSFFEYSFVKYLIDNRIECEESLSYLVSFYYQLYYRISKLVDVCTYGNIFSTEVSDMIDNSNNIIYSLGGIMGIGMNDAMGNDRTAYMKKFNDFICSRNEADFVSLLDMAGIDDFEFINGNVVEKEFKIVSELVRRKYKIKE